MLFFSLFFKYVSQAKRPISTYPVLGRWAVSQSETLIHRKIDLANEDHCGCCVFTTTNNEIIEKEDTFVICDDDVIFCF